MAAPLKRVCRQAIRQASQRHHQPLSRSTFTESAQWQPSRLSQSRLYSNTPSRREEAVAATEEEADMDTYLQTLDERLPSEPELPSTAYNELEQHRELREMVRLAAWEMPLLAQHAKPYTKPNRRELPLRWRYTTYFSEHHPASRKVVVEFRVKDIFPTERLAEGEEIKEQPLRYQEKMKKLAGVRYNPQTGWIKMSCESFETQAQNKRFLADTISKLIAESRDLSTETFEDIPLDTRHHKFKKQLHFPSEWMVTEERKLELEAKRREVLLEEGRRVEEGRIVSGAAAIEHDRQVKLAKMEQPIMEEARRPLPKGKMGKKDTGQRGR